MRRLPKHITKIILAKIMQKLLPKMDTENFHDAVMFKDCSFLLLLNEILFNFITFTTRRETQ